MAQALCVVLSAGLSQEQVDAVELARADLTSAGSRVVDSLFVPVQLQRREWPMVAQGAFAGASRCVADTSRTSRHLWPRHRRANYCTLPVCGSVCAPAVRCGGLLSWGALWPGAQGPEASRNTARRPPAGVDVVTPVRFCLC